MRLAGWDDRWLHVTREWVRPGSETLHHKSGTPSLKAMHAQASDHNGRLVYHAMNSGVRAGEGTRASGDQ